jgi:hypothetical protein
MKDPMALRHLMDEVFVQEYLYIIETTVLLSLCDLSMLQFLPWKKSRFFTLSEGYPSMGFMKICLVIKTAQSIISTACEVRFLTYYSNTNGPTTSPEAQALFYLNIIFGVFTVIFDLLVLCMRGGVLSNMQHETAMSARAERKSIFDSFSGKKTPSLKRPSAIVDLGGAYDDTDYIESQNHTTFQRKSSYDDSDMTMMSNPLHGLGDGDDEESGNNKAKTKADSMYSVDKNNNPFLSDEQAMTTMMNSELMIDDGIDRCSMIVNPMLANNGTISSSSAPARLTEIELAALAEVAKDGKGGNAMTAVVEEGEEVEL